ncbi:hypothetical protein V6N12_002782 [Hibiscus sabdariffa]|uniref:Uncharacterized protein n=1 Tax=Hibiscus sabdariffa TaxID=183260 RepID=A0ABR2EAF9_9ROSI
MITKVVEQKQESVLSGINDNKVLDELSMKTDGKLDGLDNPKKGLPNEDSPKILLELPESKAQNFEGCDDMIKWLLKPSLFQGMALNSLREDENNCHQTCQFKHLENTTENVVEGHGNGVKSREWNSHAEWITSIDIGNHKTSLLPHRQGVAGIAMIHNVKFQLLDNNAFVKSDDPYRFRLLLMGNKWYRVDGEGEMKQRSWTMVVGLHDCEKISVERTMRSCDVSINSIFTPVGGLNLIEPTFVMFEVFVPPSCMLMVVVNWLIELDVKIGGDVVLQDEFSEGIFEMELEDVDGIVASTEPNVGVFRLSCKSLVGSNIVQLLDNLPVITLEHLESCERESCLAKSDNEQWRRAEVEKPDKNLQNLKSRIAFQYHRLVQILGL